MKKEARTVEIIRIIFAIAILTNTFLVSSEQEQAPSTTTNTDYLVDYLVSDYLVSADIILPETRVPRNLPEAEPEALPPVIATAEVQTSQSNKQTVVPIEFLSQQSEAAPSYWKAWYTPYCAAAASVMVMRTFGVQIPESPLTKTFSIGRQGNSTKDPGLDPDGVSHLMQSFGGEGRIHVYRDSATALNELVGRLNYGSPVVIFGQAGNHAIVAYGYEVDEGGTVTAIYAADPLSGYSGLVPIYAWQHWYAWFGATFSAPGDQWQGAYVFVSYRDYR